MMRWLRAMVNHPMFAKVFALVSATAFALAAIALAMTMAQGSQQERDRVASDYAFCERTNTLRTQVVAVAEAALLDAGVEPEQAPRTQTAIADIVPVNCELVILGLTPGGNP